MDNKKTMPPRVYSLGHAYHLAGIGLPSQSRHSHAATIGNAILAAENELMGDVSDGPGEPARGPLEIVADAFASLCEYPLSPASTRWGLPNDGERAVWHDGEFVVCACINKHSGALDDRIVGAVKALDSVPFTSSAAMDSALDKIYSALENPFNPNDEV